MVTAFIYRPEGPKAWNHQFLLLLITITCVGLVNTNLYYEAVILPVDYHYISPSHTSITAHTQPYPSFRPHRNLIVSG